MGTVLFMHKPFVLIRKHSLFRPVAAAGSILLFVLAVFNPPNWFYVLSAIVLLLMLYFLWRQNRGIPIIFHTDGQIFVGKKPYSLTLGEFKGVASAFCRCGQTNFCLRIALIPKNVCHPVLIVQEISDVPMTWRSVPKPPPVEFDNLRAELADRLNLQDFGFLGIMGDDEWHFAVNRLPKVH